MPSMSSVHSRLSMPQHAQHRHHTGPACTASRAPPLLRPRFYPAACAAAPPHEALSVAPAPARSPGSRATARGEPWPRTPSAAPQRRKVATAGQTTAGVSREATGCTEYRNCACAGKTACPAPPRQCHRAARSSGPARPGSRCAGPGSGVKSACMRACEAARLATTYHGMW